MSPQLRPAAAPSAEMLAEPGSASQNIARPAPWTASTTTPMSKSVAESGLRSLTFRWRRQNTLVAATIIVSRGPRSSSDATSTAHDAGIAELLVPSGNVTLNAAVAAASAIITANSTGCCGMSASGGRMAMTMAPMTITEAA